MLTPLQLPSVYHTPSCDGCARDSEENRMRNKNLVDKRSQGKTERHVYISIKEKNKNFKPSLILSRLK